MGADGTLSPRLAELQPPTEEMLAALRGSQPARVEGSLLAGSKQASRALSEKGRLKGLDAFFVGLVARGMSK
jgi:hypothetical protein